MHELVVSLHNHSQTDLSELRARIGESIIGQGLVKGEHDLAAGNARST